MFDLIAIVTRAGACAIVLIAAAIPQSARAGEFCAPPGAWSIPGGELIAAPQLLARAAKAQVLLLGESHDNADHHRWELQTVAALAALRPKLVLGFEMFPRRVQAALDRWVAGELSEEAFLKASDWSRVWTYSAAFYLPLFHFARLNRMPMLALNVEREFVSRVGAKGLDAVPPEQREGVSIPAAASERYLERLFTAYAAHPERSANPPARSDLEFSRFVQAQLVWDRAMAQALADATARHPDALVIGIMGSQHVAHGDGVRRQLDHLGIQRVVSLLPWNSGTDCGDLSADLADAVFGLPMAPDAPAAPPAPLLGIQIETVAAGIRVIAVSTGSVAAGAGLRSEDVLTEAAGTAVKSAGELKAIVVRMAPGTWLPLKAVRKGEAIEFIAKFPPAK